VLLYGTTTFESAFVIHRASVVKYTSFCTGPGERMRQCGAVSRIRASWSAPLAGQPMSRDLRPIERPQPKAIPLIQQHERDALRLPRGPYGLLLVDEYRNRTVTPPVRAATVPIPTRSHWPNFRPSKIGQDEWPSATSGAEKWQRTAEQQNQLAQQKLKRGEFALHALSDLEQRVFLVFLYWRKRQNGSSEEIRPVPDDVFDHDDGMPVASFEVDELLDESRSRVVMNSRSSAHQAREVWH
jgi:hypothetical protein